MRDDGQRWGMGSYGGMWQSGASRVGQAYINGPIPIGVALSGAALRPSTVLLNLAGVRIPSTLVLPHDGRDAEAFRRQNHIANVGHSVVSLLTLDRCA